MITFQIVSVNPNADSRVIVVRATHDSEGSLANAPLIHIPVPEQDFASPALFRAYLETQIRAAVMPRKRQIDVMTAIITRLQALAGSTFQISDS